MMSANISPDEPRPMAIPPDLITGGRGGGYRQSGAPAESAQPLAAAEADPAEDDHTPTVLVVEDDEATRLAVTSWLVGEGFLVLTAASGHEALGHIEQPLEPIDVVVLDVHLPDVGGVALCRRLRELDSTIPVLVCSGGATSAEAAELLDLGASRYFRKPVDPDELLAAVFAALP